MSVEGSLDVFQLPEILQVIGHQGKTGILTVQGGGDIVAVSFLGGRLVGADSLNETGDEGLQRVLVEESLVAPEDLSRLQVQQEATGSRLLDLLVDGGYLERQQVLEALRVQYIGLLGRILRWDEGEFKFYGNDEVSYEDGLEPIAVSDLLLRFAGTFESEGNGDGRTVAVALPEGQDPLEAPEESPEDLLSVLDGGALTMPNPQPLELEDTGLGIPDLNATNPSAGDLSVDPNDTVLSPVSPAVVPAGAELGSESTRAQHPDRVYERLPSPLSIRVRAGAGEGAREEDGFLVLTPAEQQLLLQVDGLRTVDELSAAAQTSSGEAERTLARLATLELVALRVPSGDPGLDLEDRALLDRSPLAGDADPYYEDLDRGPSKGSSWAGRWQGREAATTASWVARALAAIAALLLLAQVTSAPNRLLLPFPWQEDMRRSVAQEHRNGEFLLIDRAAKTFHLTHGSFPGSLDELVAAHLLAEPSLRDVEGRRLRFDADDGQYKLIPIGRGRLLEELASTEAVTGNFLLDSDLFFAPIGLVDKPLVLVD